MAYNISKTDGTSLLTLADGTVDNRVVTSLVLVGKNYSGYGTFLNENFIRLLENFAASTAPSPALKGQLYYNTTDSRVQFYDGTRWKNLSSTAVGTSTPAGSVTGDLWWDTGTTLLKAYNGSSWTTVGPYTPPSDTGSGEIVETVLDGASSPHIIARYRISNQNVAIISKDAEFTPLTPITGFANIAPGINLSTSISNSKFVGNASNSLLLNNLSSSQFLRSDQNATTTGTLTIQNNNGLTVGASGQLQIYLDTEVNFASQIDTQDISFTTKNGGVFSKVLSLDAASRGVSTLANLSVGGNLIVTGNIVSAEFSSNLTQNGYQKLPGGLILQWGNVATTGTTTAITFPIAFPTGCLNFTVNRVSLGDTDGEAVSYVRQAPLTTTGTTISTQAGGIISYFAVGY